jgi:hypothetical protein
MKGPDTMITIKTKAPDFGTCAIAGATVILWGMTLLFGDIFMVAVPHFQ